MAVAGPFYFAWVDETETTFGSEHLRMDEYIFSARRILAEGEKPKLDLVIENPRVGLLSALRKQWCWFAWDNGSSVVPLFFGRIVGIPSDLQAETLTISFIAWPSNYVKKLQALAETMKVAPWYDPVFIDVSHRDDPMSIFEGYSKMVCVDPVTHAVKASDILDAEDGNVDFTADDHFYSSLSISPGAVPKTAVHVDASVSWTQTANGYMDMGTQSIISYTGDGLISDWPKALSTLAPGMTIFTSSAFDQNHVDLVTTKTWASSWQNKEKQHNDGDTLSLSVSHSGPSGGSYLTTKVSESYQPGFLDPFAVDDDGNISPTNIPMSYNSTTSYQMLYHVVTNMIVEYRAARPHTERIIFTLFADVQPTTLDPLVTDDSDTITISGSDVGVPIINLLAWSTISGTHVSVDTVIFPDNPSLPGGKSAQIAIIAGTAGTVEPEFSDVIGETTVDGSVMWASLGVATPTENATNWSGAANVPIGTVILPQRPIYTTYAAFVAAGAAANPPQPTGISEGTIILNGDGNFYVCTVSGDIGPNSQLAATLVSLGATLPDGKTYWLAKTGGLTGAQYVIPPFGSNTALNSTVTDGGVVWVNIGVGDIPVGGTTGNVTGQTYFGIARGQRSIHHLILRARARLRYTSRAVTSNFECSYLKGTSLSLRMSATLHDPRIPGGVMEGKITGTELMADSGKFTCKVTLGSSVGKVTTITEVAGTPVYVQATYVEVGYQAYDGQIVIVPVVSDVGYTPIVPVADEDGVSFPLTKSSIVVSERIIGTIDGQVTAIRDQFKQDISSFLQSQFGASAWTTEIQRDPQAAGTTFQNALSTVHTLAANPIWYDLVLKPINGNGSFNHVYHLKCTKLALPEMIDLTSDGRRAPHLPSTTSPIVSALVLDSSTFYTPTVAHAGSLLFVDTDIFHAPILTGGGITTLFIDTDVFYAPILARTGIFPLRVSDTDTFYTPAVSAGGLGSSIVIDTDWATYNYYSGDPAASDPPATSARTFWAEIEPFNTGSMVRGVDYTSSLTIYPSSFPNGTKNVWSYPEITASGHVYGADLLQFGAYYNGSPWHNQITPTRIRDLTSWTVTHDVSIAGETNTFDTIYDWYTWPGPVATSSIAHEFSITLHPQDYEHAMVAGLASGLKSNYTDPQGRSWILYCLSGAGTGHQYVFTRADGSDTLSGTLDLLGFMNHAASQGWISTDEYVTGTGLACEVASGHGSFTVNSISFNFNGVTYQR